jgi:hypothetical protein
MSNIRFSKVKRTDYRNGTIADDPAARSMEAEKCPHDAAARELSDHALLAAAADLGRRRYHNRRDPEHRWGMDRLGALGREISRRGIA